MAKSRGRARDPRPEERRSLALRTLTLIGVAVLGWLLFYRAPGPGRIPASALRMATAAGCDDLERPVVSDPSRDHLAPGEPLEVDDPPPAAGAHDPEPLPAEPHVHREPVSAARAVHNLEHAYVLIWYRTTAEGGLTEETIDALERLAAEEDRVIIAPYPDLPEGTSLALLAWNTRWRCPSGATSGQAVEIASGFVDAYRGTTNAPEAPRGLLGRLFVS